MYFINLRNNICNEFDYFIEIIKNRQFYVINN